MNFNPRIITIKNFEHARAELTEIGSDASGIGIMSAKTIFTVIKLEKVSAKAANILKQTFLAKGGEVAVRRGTADLSVASSDVLICATGKQYTLALAQLKMQPWGLPDVAAAIEATLNSANVFPAREYAWPDRKLSIRPFHTLIMGILNITPDSFSDGGQFITFDAAMRQAKKLIADGADILDIGAESTRPYGAEKITAAEEKERLLPVLEKILAISPIPVSVDTYKAEVADAALKLGAHIINDIWGLQYDPDMARVIASYNAPVVVMHNRDNTVYTNDIIADISAFLRRSIEIGVKQGIETQNIIIDPGIGFGKTPAQNLVVMSRLAEFQSLGYPMLLGTSRKKFIGEALGGLPVEDRLEGTAATVSYGISNGAHIVRVHDVKAMSRVAKMTDTMLGGIINE